MDSNVEYRPSWKDAPWWYEVTARLDCSYYRAHEAT